EYAVVDAGAFYKKPTTLNFAAASTVCSALATADNALFALAALSRGQTVLIHGASGAVGGFAVQLAKRTGARVIATASGRNVQRVRDLGADMVVDYKKDRSKTMPEMLTLCSTRLAGPRARARLLFFGEAACSSRLSHRRRTKSLQPSAASGPCSTGGSHR